MIDTIGDLGVEGRVILECFLMRQGEGVQWIHLVKNMVQCVGLM